MNIAEKIKNARNQAGFSQQELAEKLHVSRSAVAKWEADKGLPDIENLKSIAKLFGMTVDELVDDEEDCGLCTLCEKIPPDCEPDDAVRARWPEAVRIDGLLLRYDFGPVGRALNLLSFGWFGATWRLFHWKECDMNRCRYYLVDNFDEHLFVQAENGELHITPLGRRCLNSERDTFHHKGRTYMGLGKLRSR